MLPTVHNQISKLNPPELTNALLNFAPVTGGNEIHAAREGNLSWVGNKMEISNNGLVNYSYIPAVEKGVSYGVVDQGAGGGEFYVFSDQYGGCEYHQLFNPTTNQTAFLHVYRGDGIVTSYMRAAGWKMVNILRSAKIAARGGMRGTNISVSYLRTTCSPPIVRTKFIHVDNPPMIPAQGFQNTPSFIPAQISNYSTVTMEDDGWAPY
jgi:hypothetical protein